MSMVQVVPHPEYQEQVLLTHPTMQKGLKLAKGKIGNPDVEVLLKWNKVAERVRQLIRTDDFLSPEELEKYEERQEARRLADLEEAQQMLGEQLEQDTFTAEDITDLRLVDSEYMSGTRTKNL